LAGERCQDLIGRAAARVKKQEQRSPGPVMGVVMQLGRSTGGCGSEDGEDRCASMWKGEAIFSRNVMARGETTQHGDG